MYLKFYSIFNSIYNTQHRYLHKYVLKMDQAYLRNINSEQFQITFQYINSKFKMNRQFKFLRRFNETVEMFTSRVSVNIQKFMNKKTKKKEETNNETQVNVSIILNNELIKDDFICREVFKEENNVILKVIDQEYEVIINSPWIDNIALPTSLLSTFPVYPARFESISTDNKLSEFIWYKSRDKKNWSEIGMGFIYTIKNTDINCFLKLCCTPKNDRLSGPAVEVVSDVKVDASPGECPFEGRHVFTKEETKFNEFRVVSYNILADYYCDSDYSRTELFPYCPPYALAIDYRKQLILKELLGYNSDIICLQEVDKKVFNYDLQTVFSNLKFDSYLTLKGSTAEGLACFYNKEKFSLIEANSIVLGKHIDKQEIFADIWEKVSQNEKLKERILHRSTTIQTITLNSLDNNNILLVANTHLYFHPNADHIRLLQGGFCIRYIQHLIENLKIKFPSRTVSLIFCGDFNSVPECGIYKLYTSGEVSEDCIDFQSYKEEAVENINLKQPFQLRSACGTPKYTNFTAGFCDCLDYIYYDTNGLEVSQVIPLPSEEELRVHTAIPSIVFPSDHVALVSDLKWL